MAMLNGDVFDVERLNGDVFDVERLNGDDETTTRAANSRKWQILSDTIAASPTVVAHSQWDL